MSGHSKWSKIKRQKQAGDLKKGALFTRLSQGIIIAAREGGSGDPEMNFMLRIAIDKAKEANMPKDNIERAIRKGLGEGDSGPLESITYEIVGKAGIAILVDCLTDNKNRTISDIRKLVHAGGFEMGSGSMGWQFESRGLIVVEAAVRETDQVKGKEVERFVKVDKEKLMLELMEIEGVEDVEEKKEAEGDFIRVVTVKDKFKSVCQELENRHLRVLKAGIAKEPKSKLQVSEDDRAKIKLLVDQLEDNPDVISMWSNVGLE